MFYQVKRYKNVTKQLKGDKNMCFLRLKKNHNIKYTRFFQFNQSSCVIPVDIFTILFIIHGSNSIATQLNEHKMIWDSFPFLILKAIYKNT